MPAFSKPWRFHNAGSEELLPGEFRLIQSREEDDSVVLVLNPVPSIDPNEPLNWSTSRKVANYILVLVATLAFWAALSTQYTFWGQMADDMHVTFEDLNRAQSGGMAGLAIGCIFFIPLAKKYGRRSTYVLSTAAMAATSWWSAKMTTVEELYITNLIYGLAGATNETIVQLTISDLFFVHQRGKMNAVYLTTSLVGCSLSPMLAGIQASKQGWRMSYVALSISMTLLTVILCFGYEETKYIKMPDHEDVRLCGTTASSDASRPSETKGPKHMKVSIDRVQSDPSSNSSPISLKSYKERLRWFTPSPESLPALFVFPFRIIFLPYVVFASLLNATCVIWVLISSSISTLVFSLPPYNFDTAGLGYLGLAPLVGFIFGGLYAGFVGDWAIAYLARKNGGIFQPEFRLYPLPLPVVALSAGLIIFGVTASKGMHWIFPSVGCAVFSFGVGAIGDVVYTILIDVYQPITADVFIIVSLFRNLGSIGMVFAIAPWNDHAGLINMHITMGVLAFITGMTFLPFIYWGRRIRKVSLGRYEGVLKAHDSIWPCSGATNGISRATVAEENIVNIGNEGRK